MDLPSRLSLYIESKTKDFLVEPLMFMSDTGESRDLACNLFPFSDRHQSGPASGEVISA